MNLTSGRHFNHKALLLAAVLLTSSSAFAASKTKAESDAFEGLDAVLSDGKVAGLMATVLKSIDFNALSRVMEKQMAQGMKDMAEGKAAPQKSTPTDTAQTAEVMTLPDGEEVIVIRKAKRQAAPAPALDAESQAAMDRMAQNMQRDVAPAMGKIMMQVLPVLMKGMQQSMGEIAKDTQEDAKSAR